MKQKNILVLGSSGMLGSMVFSHLQKNNNLNVIGTVRSESLLSPQHTLFNAKDFTLNSQQEFHLDKYDYIINCIGIIKPYCKDDDPEGVQNAIIVNSLFPHMLAHAIEKTNSRLIQIATDCIYSGQKGNYTEDDPSDAVDAYGKTKRLGEINKANCLNIRCSIIGPEQKNYVSLLEWFLAHKKGAILKGFSHHQWNGVTTLQFAELCEKIIEKDNFTSLLEISPVHHFIPNESLNKFELLNLFAKVFSKKLIIEEVKDIGPAIQRTLSSKFNKLQEIYPPSSLEKALTKLKMLYY